MVLIKNHKTEINELNSLTAISHLMADTGRNLMNSTSIFRIRTDKVPDHVEIEYFIALCDIPLPQLTDFRKEDYKTYDRCMRILALRTLRK